jgi:hypothetical protein
MIRLKIKLIVLLLVFTFSFNWISEQFSILTNEKKYDFYELSEKNPGENNSEGKLKLLFIAKIEFLNCFENCFLDESRIHSSDLFKVKECVQKNTTPPPRSLA